MISRFWLWRWMFWRRIRCSAWVPGISARSYVPCERPAVLKCLRFDSSTDTVCGGEFPRDPLCAIHGKEGLCPTDRNSQHVLIPESQRWRRVRFGFHFNDR
jgi:hypothetical protein